MYRVSSERDSSATGECRSRNRVTAREIGAGLGRSIAGAPRLGTFFTEEKRGGTIRDERDGLFIPRRSDVDINNVAERLSNDPETFRHLSGSAI